MRYWFENSSVRMKWSDTLSKEVSLSAGVRQGGVLSPWLFSIYIDIILEKLEISGLGCFLGKQCLNSFLYADDLIILTLSVSDLQKLVNICQSTFTEIGLTINIKKSHCIRIGSRHNNPCRNIIVGDQSISWVKETKFLGVFIKSGNYFSCNWHEAKSNFYKASNAILSKLGSNPSTDVCLKLIHSQCVPILTYGLCAVSILPSDANKLSFAYNSIFCKLFKCNHVQTINYCQYFCNYWQLDNVMDYNRFCFLRKLFQRNQLSLIMSIDKVDYDDLMALALKYDFLLSDSNFIIKRKIWIFVKNKLEL